VRERIVHRMGQAALILALFAYGCASAPTKTPSEGPPQKAPEKAPEKDPYAQLSDRYRALAMEHEKRGELPRALLCWEIVQALQPADEEAAKRIVSLKAGAKTLADQHFKKGLSFYQSRSIPAARKEFLKALYYAPDNTEILSYLKDKLDEDNAIYEVKPGDTLKGIAKNIYGDPEKDFLIAYFNDLGKDPKLAPKTVLRLPLLDLPQAKLATPGMPAPTAPGEQIGESPKETEKMMAKAAAYFKANKFKEAASITDEILLSDPSNKEARNLTNASYYQMGKTLHQQKRYEEALDQLERVDPGYQDVAVLIGGVKRQLADLHYVRGIKYFTEEKLDKAIEEWQETLKLNPQHPKAKDDMENAAKLLQKLKEIK